MDGWMDGWMNYRLREENGLIKQEDDGWMIGWIDG